jgi:hypothetical protein
VTEAARWADWFVLRPSRDGLDFGDQSVLEIPTQFGRVQVFRRLVNAQKGGKPQVRFLKAPGTAGRAERSTDFPFQVSAFPSSSEFIPRPNAPNQLSYKLTNKTPNLL